jgi:hypothetical protein
MGEHRQTVAGEQKLAPDPFGRNRVISRDVAYDPADVDQSLGTPDDGQRLVRFGRRRVELALRQPQKPFADFLVRHRSWVCVRVSDGRGEHLGLGFVFLDQGDRCCHAEGYSIRIVWLHLLFDLSTGNRVQEQSSRELNS